LNGFVKNGKTKSCIREQEDAHLQKPVVLVTSSAFTLPNQVEFSIVKKLK